MSKKTIIAAAASVAIGIFWLGCHQADKESSAVTKTSISGTTNSTRLPDATDTHSLTDQKPALSAQSQHHSHSSTDSPQIPAEIEQALEAQRVPVSELNSAAHPHGGHLTDLKGQYRTVTVAVTDEQGQVHLIEKRITPIPDTQMSVPAPADTTANTANQ